MKRAVIAILAAGASLCSCSETTQRAIPQDGEIEKKVEQVLSRMSLEEKAGQMVQLTSSVIIKPGTHEVSPEGEAILRKYKIGSILNSMNDVADTPEAYRQFIGQIQQISID